MNKYQYEEIIDAVDRYRLHEASEDTIRDLYTHLCLDACRLHEQANAMEEDARALGLYLIRRKDVDAYEFLKEEKS